MSFRTTITKAFVVLTFLIASNMAIGQKKTDKNIVKAAYVKLPSSIRNNSNFKKSYLFYIDKEYDSTLFYSSKFLNSQSLGKKSANFCHFFRGVSFEAKELFREAQKEFNFLPRSFIMYLPAKLKSAGIALQLEEYHKALKSLLEIKELPDQNVFEFEEDRILHDIGLCYLHLEKYDQSEEYLFQSLEIQEKKQDTALMVGSYMDIASLYYAQYKDDQAIPFFEKAYSLSKHTNDYTLKQNAALNMAIVDENRKNFIQSIQYRKEYEQWRDSINDQNKIWEVAQLEKKFISEQKQGQIELLAKDNNIKKAQLNTFIYSSILLILLLGTLLYFYLSKRKANKLILSQKTELDALNDTKDRLFSVVSHDLRSNVNALDRSNIEMSEMVGSRNFDDLGPELQHNTELTGSIKGLLDNMLSWALLQTEQMYFQQENISMVAVARQTTHNYLPLLKSKGIELINTIPNDIFIYADIESLKIVLRNVLDNAIKFSDYGDPISIYSKDHSKSHCKLIVEDTGRGMNESTLHELVEKSRSASKSINQERTGLGLHLCHAMILKNEGELTIESEENVGTKLIITLPLSQDHE